MEQKDISSILVVDDREDERDMAAQAVRMLGHQVITAANGQEALDLIHRGRFDLVVTDIQMPVMDGLTLLRTIRAEGSTIPVLLITGFDPTEADEAVRKYGPAGLLLKPFRLQHLREEIGKLLGITE